LIETRDNSEKWYHRRFRKGKASRVPLIASLILVILFIYLGIAYTQATSQTVYAIRDLFATYLGWFYILVVTSLVVLTIWLMLSRYGQIKLGQYDDVPEFNYFSWFAMLFSCGMGIGLVFWSVAEPVEHLANPLNYSKESIGAAKASMHITYYHWGLHPWAVFSAMGVALAYFAYRHDLPLSIRSLFYPFLGSRIYGWPGHIVDVLAVFTTVLGIATSLGLGGIQINAGLNNLGFAEINTQNQVIIVAALSIIATISVASGLKRGIKLLSNINLSLSIFFVIFFLAFGPTRFLFNFFVQSVGHYISGLVRTSFWTASFEHQQWLKSWTLFYWAWWISWSPFVSLFIARISKGRTVREFILGVLFVPTILSFIWLLLFGGTSLHIEVFNDQGLIDAVNDNLATAVYTVLDTLPLSLLTSPLLTILIAIYFVTSCDSSVLVINTILTQSHEPRALGSSIAWGLSMGGVAIVLLLVGGLEAIRSVTITTGIPFLIVLLGGLYGLIVALERDYQKTVIGRQDINVLAD